MWNRIKQAIKKWLNKQIPEITPPILKKDEPVKTTIPPLGVDAIVFESIHHEGGNHSNVGRNALPIKILRGAKIVGDKIHLDYDKVTDWQPMEHVEKDKDGNEVRWNSYGRLCCASNFQDGAWRGSHFDWLSGDQKVKLMENIFNGYLFKPPPPQDAKFMIWIVSNDGSKRTNIVEATR